MRRGIDSKILLNQNNNPYAIFMGAGYCAEHEWGIKKLEKELEIGLDKEILGKDLRKVNKNFPKLELLIDKRKKEACLIAFSDFFYSPHESKINTVHRVKKYYGLVYIKDETFSAWNSESFCFFVKGQKNIDFLKSLHSAAQVKDVMLFLYNESSNNPFSKFGLILADYNKLDTNMEKDMLYYDQLAYDLNKESEKVLNKYPQLKELGSSIQFRWKDDSDKIIRNNQRFFIKSNEKLIVKFQSHKSELNSGLFTVEEVLDFLNNKGPIIKENFKKWLKEYNKANFLKESRRDE